VRLIGEWLRGRRGVRQSGFNNRGFLRYSFTLQSLLADYPPFQELLRPID
jgi:hypothetical protein